MRYFGYGSNLHLADLRRFCAERGHDPGAIRRLGPAWLPDHAPVFHYRSAARGGGALSVCERFGAATPGALFEVDPAGWAALDDKEGAKYERVERIVLVDGDEVPAATYVVRPEHRERVHVPPTRQYLRLVIEGLSALSLPTEAVRGAGVRLVAPPLPRVLFVYGTLLRGEERAWRLERHRPTRWSEGTCQGALVDLGPYPGLVPGPGSVRGELVEFEDPAEALRELDEVEDFLGYGVANSLYRRVVVRAGSTWAWTYRYIGPPGPVIASGDWRART